MNSVKCFRQDRKLLNRKFTIHMIVDILRLLSFRFVFGSNNIFIMNWPLVYLFIYLFVCLFIYLPITYSLIAVNSKYLLL